MKTITLVDGTVLNATDSATATQMTFEVAVSGIAGILAKLTTENMRHVVIKDDEGKVIQDENRVISTGSATVNGEFDAETITLSVTNRYMTQDEITEERLSDLEDAVLGE